MKYQILFIFLLKIFNSNCKFSDICILVIVNSDHIFTIIAPRSTFQPLPLDLSETRSDVSESELASVKLQDQSQASVKHQDQSQLKQSLEDKVSDFLARLQQDSINLSLDIPKPRPFDG